MRRCYRDRADIDRVLGCSRNRHGGRVSFLGLAVTDPLIVSVLFGAATFIVGAIGG
jgi:hypothetical protein